MQINFGQFDWKRTVSALLIGALTAFLTSLFDGIIDLLQNYGNNFTGATAAIIYSLKLLK